MNLRFKQASDDLHAASSELLKTVISSETCFASLFLEHSSRSAHLRSIKEISAGRPVRDLHESIEGMSVYAFSKDDAAHEAIEGLDTRKWHDAAHGVANRLGGKKAGRRINIDRHFPAGTLPADAPDTVSPSEKQTFIRDLLDVAVSYHSDVYDAQVEYQDITRRILLINSENQSVERFESRLGVKISVKLRNGAGETAGSASRWTRGGFGDLVFDEPENLVRKAVEHAIAGREARSVPAGPMPVVFAGGWAGLWVHEAIGHTLECDVTPSRWRAQLGRPLGSGIPVTLIDTPVPSAVDEAPAYDDEGSTCQPTLLIEDGRLEGLLTDRRTALKYKLPKTGNGRCQDYRFPPIPRMDRLCLQAGVSAPEDLIASVRNGIYVTRVEAGKTTGPGGEFELRATGGYRIERGRLTHPIQPTLLHSDAKTALAQIRGIGTDLRCDDSEGRCVKSGQTVTVAVQAPSILIDKVQATPAT